MKKLAASLLTAGIMFATASTAAPVTVNDSNFYTDLSTGTSHVLDGFTLAGPVSGPATLHVRYGQWNGSFANLSITLNFAGTDLSSLISTGAYYSSPASIDFDVSSLLTTGVNTLSTFGSLLSGGPVTYSLGEISLTYDSDPGTKVPEPSVLVLLGIAAVAGVASRRRRITSSNI